MCAHCEGDGRLRKVTRERKETVGGVTFVATLPAKECPECGEIYTNGDLLCEFDRGIARYFAVHGIRDGVALKLMRKAAGMSNVELSAMLDISSETLSRWETNKHEIDVSAAAIISLLVLERLGEPLGIEEVLSGYAEPAPNGTVKLAI